MVGFEWGYDEWCLSVRKSGVRTIPWGLRAQGDRWAWGAHREGKLVEGIWLRDSIQGPVYISYPGLLFSFIFLLCNVLVIFQFSSVAQSCLTATPWIAAHQASLSITNSRSALRLTSIESVMPSSHLILCHPLLLLPPIPPSIRVFSNESALCMRWPKYWSFSFSNNH